jgi:glycosyltransferase involved in cell wall biosynthesis
MKILYHHRTLADGAEGIHIAEMVEAFEALGHQVTMHSLAGSNRRGEGRPSVWGRLKAWLPAAAYELAAMAYNAVDYLTFRAAIRRHRPRLVYKRHALYDIGVIMAARHEGIPLVLEVNRPYSSSRYLAFEPLRFPRTTRWFERHAFGMATVVAVVSSPLRDFVLEAGASRERILLLPNGANPDRFDPTHEGGRSVRRRYGVDDRVVIGWAGILREWHRLDLLLPALQVIPNAVLLVVGDGPDRRRLEELADAMGVRSRVLVIGRVAHDSMPAHVAAMDISVASDDRTGVASPMKVLEYMAMARAVVAPRMPNIEDFLKDGIEGMLFQPGDSDDLAAVLTRLAKDSDLRERLGAAARIRIERDRNWRHNAELVIDATAAVLAGRPMGVSSESRLPSEG